jgi:hypothetical protein
MRRRASAHNAVATAEELGGPLLLSVAARRALTVARGKGACMSAVAARSAEASKGLRLGATRTAADARASLTGPGSGA